MGSKHRDVERSTPDRLLVLSAGPRRCWRQRATTLGHSAPSASAGVRDSTRQGIFFFFFALFRWPPQSLKSPSSIYPSLSLSLPGTIPQWMVAQRLRLCSAKRRGSFILSSWQDAALLRYVDTYQSDLLPTGTRRDHTSQGRRCCVLSRGQLAPEKPTQKKKKNGPHLY